MKTFKVIDERTNETLLETDIDTSKNLSENSFHFAGTIEQAKKLFALNENLYCSLVCALTHNIDTCDKCKKCPGKDGAEIRMNMVKALAEYKNKEVPWSEGGVKMNRPNELIKELKEFNELMYGYELSSAEYKELTGYISKLEKALDKACKELAKLEKLFLDAGGYEEFGCKEERWKEWLLKDE